MFRKTLLTAFALILLGSIPALAQTDAPAASPATTPSPRLALATLPTAPVSTELAPEALPQFTIVATSTGTWQFLTRESCIDLFGRNCTSSFPSPQCPPNAQGKSCSPVGSFCYDTISSGTVDLYRCRS